MMAGKTKHRKGKQRQEWRTGAIDNYDIVDIGRIYPETTGS
jgi:hypothetical protein